MLLREIESEARLMNSLRLYEVGLYVSIAHSQATNLDELLKYLEMEKRNDIICGLQNLMMAGYIEIDLTTYSDIKIVGEVKSWMN